MNTEVCKTSPIQDKHNRVKQKEVQIKQQTVKGTNRGRDRNKCRWNCLQSRGTTVCKAGPYSKLSCWNQWERQVQSNTASEWGEQKGNAAFHIVQTEVCSADSELCNKSRYAGTLHLWLINAYTRCIYELTYGRLERCKNPTWNQMSLQDRCYFWSFFACSSK